MVGLLTEIYRSMFPPLQRCLVWASKRGTVEFNKKPKEAVSKVVDLWEVDPVSKKILHFLPASSTLSIALPTDRKPLRLGNADYINMDAAQALQDFKHRVQQYAEVYEPVQDDECDSLWILLGNSLGFGCSCHPRKAREHPAKALKLIKDLRIPQWGGLFHPLIGKVP